MINDEAIKLVKDRLKELETKARSINFENCGLQGYNSQLREINSLIEANLTILRTLENGTKRESEPNCLH